MHAHEIPLIVKDDDAYENLPKILERAIRDDGFYLAPEDALGIFNDVLPISRGNIRGYDIRGRPRRVKKFNSRALHRAAGREPDLDDMGRLSGIEKARASLRHDRNACRIKKLELVPE